MSNSYQIDLSESNLQGPIASLEVLYEGMPTNVGCAECEEINGKDSKDWCCKKQSPSMYYVEFLYVFKHVQEKWTKLDRESLLLRAIRNYLSNSLSKGCIFYDKGCSVYEHRPYGCRIYAVIPQETWDKRWEALKVRQGEKFEAKPQCDLVTPLVGISVSKEEKWFQHTKKCEERIGVSKVSINLHDAGGGSYRTFHDHLILELLGEDVMGFLSDVRMTNPEAEEIDDTVEKIRELMNAQTLHNKVS